MKLESGYLCRVGKEDYIFCQKGLFLDSSPWIFLQMATIFSMESAHAACMRKCIETGVLPSFLLQLKTADTRKNVLKVPEVYTSETCFAVSLHWHLVL